VAVCILATALGVITVRLAMTTPPASSRNVGSSPHTELAVADAAIFEVNGAPEASGLPPGHDAAPEPAIDAPTAERDKLLALPPDAPLPAPSGAPAHWHAGPDAGARRQSPADVPQPGPIDPALSAPAPSSAGSNQSSPETLSSLFHDGDYAAVVRICAAAPVSRDIAGVCVMAACQDHNSAQAERWLPTDDPATRDQLATYCRERGGIDLGRRLDCAANPLDCR
jgi:hypothetical protein